MVVTVMMMVTPATVVMVMPRREHPYEVHGQSNYAHNQELVRVHLGRVDESLDSLKDDKHRNEDEEDPVGKARERLDPRVPATLSR
jgi:hypothetical protein